MLVVMMRSKELKISGFVALMLIISHRLVVSVVVLQVKALAAQLDKWNPATADEMLKTIPSPWFKKLQVHHH